MATKGWPARAVAMNSSRHQLFAGSAFTANQNGGIGGRDFAHQLEKFAHARGGAHHVVLHVDGFLKAAILRLEPFETAGPFKGHSQIPRAAAANWRC